MNRRWILAAAVAATGIGVSAAHLDAQAPDGAVDANPPAGAMDNNPSGNTAAMPGGELNQPGNHAYLNQSDRQAIRSSLAQATTDLLQPNGLNSLQRHLAQHGNQPLGAVGTAVPGQTSPARSNQPGQGAAGEQAPANPAMPEQANPGQPEQMVPQHQYGQQQDQSGQSGQMGQTAQPGSLAGAQEKQLNQQIEEFRKNWRDKYGQDFGPQQAQQGLAMVQVEPGLMANQARLAGERIGPGGGAGGYGLGGTAGTSGNNGTSSDKNGGAGGDSAGNQSAAGGNAGSPIGGATAGGIAGQSSGSAGSAAGALGNEQTATAILPADHGLPAVQVHLIQESPGTWKLDLPAGQSMQTLGTRLTQQVRQLNEAKANWPSDQKQAATLVSHHVLMAVSSPATGNEGFEVGPRSQGGEINTGTGANSGAGIGGSTSPRPGIGSGDGAGAGGAGTPGNGGDINRSQP